MRANGPSIEEYASHTQFYGDDVSALLVRLLEQDSWNRCMDLGCGDGSLLDALKNRGHLESKQVYALDYSKKRMGLLNRQNRGFGCVVGSACEIPLRDESIDLLVSTQVIEHVLDDGDMVAEMHRVLQTNGVLYLSTVFKKWYGWYFYRCQGKWTLDPTHLREYTDDHQLLDKIRNHDFEILENRKYPDGRPIMDSILRRAHASRNVYDNRLLKKMRALRVPIPGYFIWEIVCRKR